MTSSLSTASAKKLIAALGQQLTLVLHHDVKENFTLVVDAARRAHLLSGLVATPGVTVTTSKHSSIHYSDQLVRLTDLKTWLGDAKSLDERFMRWRGGGYCEAVRFGRRVLVVEGGNNARNLQSVGLTFDAEAEAVRFFKSFCAVLPKGWVNTGPVHVAGSGGISREYLGCDEQRKKGVHAAIVQVLDEVLLETLVDPKGNRRSTREVFRSEAEAIAALNAFELAWYRAGGAQHEIEYMASLKRRTERTLIEHLQSELESRPNRAAFVQQLLGDAGLPVPDGLSEDESALLRAVYGTHPAHWLLVGERLPKDVKHYEVENRTPTVHVYCDPKHRAVAEITVDERRGTWARVKRLVDQKKYDALVAKTLKRLELA
jgi:hypothetical protein